jgi:transposase
MKVKQNFDLSEMQKICDEHFREALSNLTALPGVSQISAMIIVAETGCDMSAFENSGKLVMM